MIEPTALPAAKGRSNIGWAALASLAVTWLVYLVVQMTAIVHWSVKDQVILWVLIIGYGVTVSLSLVSLLLRERKRFAITAVILMAGAPVVVYAVVLLALASYYYG